MPVGPEGTPQAVTRRLSLAEGLEDIQAFVDDKPTSIPAERWLHRLQDSLGDGPRTPELWSSLLLVGMRSTDDDLRRLCTRQYLDLMQSEDSARPLLSLLSSLLEEYDAYERPRAVLIQRIYRELQRRRFDRRSETVRFLLSLQQIFQISYDQGFVDGSVRCLLLLLRNRQRPSDRALSDTIRDRIRVTLRHGGVPEITELTIKRQLGTFALEDVPSEFIASIYARLVEENSRPQVLGSLALLRRWYAHIPRNQRKDPQMFDERLREWRLGSPAKGGKLSVTEDVELTRILEANSNVVDLLVRLTDHWVDRGQICEAAVGVLRRLPAARRLIASPDRKRWPVFLEEFRRPDRRHLLPAALGFYERFASGLRVDLRPGDEDADGQDLKTYRRQLRFVHRWADLESDRWVVQTISDLCFDPTRPLPDRRRCLSTLDAIDPGDLPQRLAEYAAENPSTDPLVPDVLDLIQRREDWRFWDVCAHYLSLVGPASPATSFPLVQSLIRAAGSTGHAGMVTTLLPWAFDASDPESQKLAEAALDQAGYGVFVERERLARYLQSLQPEKNSAADELRQVFERIGQEELRKLRAQTQVSDHRFGFEQSYTEMGLQLTNYQSFTTGKMIDLAIIDKQLEELTQKIRHLTQRKNQLEVQRDRLLERKRALLRELDRVEDQTRRTQRRERETRHRLDQLIRRNQELERQRSRRAAAVESALRRLREVERQQRQQIHNLESRYHRLQGEERDNQSGIQSCQGQINNQQHSLHSASSALSGLEARARGLQNERSRLPADSPRRHSLQSSISSVRGQISSQHSTISRIEGNIAGLRRQIDGHSRRIAEIQSSGRQIQHDIRAAGELISNQESRVSSARRSLDACLREIAAVNQQIHAQQATLTAIRDQLNHLAAEGKRLREILTVLQEEEARIRRELLPVIRSLEEAKRQYERINAQREAEEQDLRQNNRRYETVTRELGQALDDRQQRLGQLHGEIRQVHRTLSGLAQKETRSENRLNELVTRIRDHMKQFENLRDKSEKLLIKQDDIAHSRSLLRRANQDRRELEKLYDAYQLSKAAESFVQITRRADE